MTKANLTHIFELHKEKAELPLVQVQIGVEYDPESKQVTPVSLNLYCHVTRSFMNMTPVMDKLFFQGIIAQEIAIVDWDDRYIEHQQIEARHMARIADSEVHSIGTESFIYGDHRQKENEDFMQKVNNHFEHQEQNY